MIKNISIKSILFSKTEYLHRLRKSLYLIMVHLSFVNDSPKDG